MNIFLIIDETPFYHPAYLHGVLQGLHAEDRVVGAGVVTRIPRRNDINAYLLRQWRLLTWREMTVLAWRKYTALLQDRLAPRRREGPHHSVAAVLDAWEIPRFPVRDSVNTPEVLERVRAARTDVLLSSNSLIFGEKLLAIPTLCTLNRHGALLPAHGGLWPMFHAVAAGDREAGASVQVMVKEIDKGPVLAQQGFPITPGESLYDLYERCFAVSVAVTLAALERVRAGDFTPVPTSRPPSYHTFPREEDWQAFRRHGGRFV